MDILVKDFIEENIDLIEDNKWEEVYNNASELPLSSREALTSILLEADIDPLNYLNYIPDFYLAGQDINSFNIPSHIKRINKFAFYYCTSLTNVTIPDSVTSIGYVAFHSCYSLTSIKFNGTKAQWKAISKGSDWKCLVPASCIVYCRNGKLKI